jgi:hypothetical protein
MHMMHTDFPFAPELVRHIRRLLTLHYNGQVPETQLASEAREGAWCLSGPFSTRQMSSIVVRSARRQAVTNPRSRRCSCLSCGRFLESATTRVRVRSSANGWAAVRLERRDPHGSRNGCNPPRSAPCRSNNSSLVSAFKNFHSVMNTRGPIKVHDIDSYLQDLTEVLETARKALTLCLRVISSRMAVSSPSCRRRAENEATFSSELPRHHPTRIVQICSHWSRNLRSSGCPSDRAYLSC